MSISFRVCSGLWTISTESFFAMNLNKNLELGLSVTHRRKDFVNPHSRLASLDLCCHKVEDCPLVSPADWTATGQEGVPLTQGSEIQFYSKGTSLVQWAASVILDTREFQKQKVFRVCRQMEVDMNFRINEDLIRYFFTLFAILRFCFSSSASPIF